MRSPPGGSRPDDASGAEALAGRGGAHPDLVERLLAVVPETASPLAGEPSIVVHPNGRVVAFATGMSRLVLRLGVDPTVDVDALDARPWTPGDGSWWSCSAWLTDVPTAEGLALLRQACRAAFDVVGATA